LYLFLKTENSRRVAESRPVCVGLYTANGKRQAKKNFTVSGNKE
jgi:hypothetical protein